MRVIFGFILFVCVGLLAGCATLSKAQCETGNWQGLGKHDGGLGHPTSRLGEHQQACSKHNININKSLYKKGHKQGLKHYCTLENAAKAATAGKTYYYVCTGEKGVSILRIFKKGRDIHNIDDEISALEYAIKSKTEELSKPDISQVKRERLAQDIKFAATQLANFYEKRAKLEAELRQIMLEEERRLNRH